MLRQGDGVGAAFGGGGGYFFRGGGKSDERAPGIHGRHAGVGRRFGEVIPAAIEEDDIGLVLRFLEASQHALRSDRLFPDIARLADAGTFGNEVVFALKFPAVAGEVKQSRAVVLRHLRAELLDGVLRLHQARVFHDRDAESHALQRRLHPLQVGGNPRQALQSKVPVILTYAHHEGEAGFRPGGDDEEQGGETAEQDGDGHRSGWVERGSDYCSRTTSTRRSWARRASPAFLFFVRASCEPRPTEAARRVSLTPVEISWVRIKAARASESF